MAYQEKYRPTVGITQGDGNGIGYEVIIKALADERILDSFTPVIYGSSKLFAFYRKSIREAGQAETFVASGADNIRPKKINIINCLPDNAFAEPGQATADSAKGAILSLAAATEDLKAGKIDALVTAPINKRTMNEAGFGFTGHTEYLEKAFGVEDGAMFMVSDWLKVAVVAGHVPIRAVPSCISTERILSKLRIMKASLERDFRHDAPKIAVLGLNPHCGDGGLIGDEEQNIIVPAINQAQSEGINAFGPYSADGFFSLGNYTKFDAVLAMYHDQGLIPFKAIAFEDGVNFTAGLPIVRTSPDHGTAFEKAGQDIADPRSMMSAIYTAIDVLRNRREYDAILAGKMEERQLPDYKGRRSQGGRPQIA